MPEYIGLRTRVEVGKAYALDGFGAFHFEPYQGNGDNCDDCAFKDVDFPCERFACDESERDDGLNLYAVKIPGDTVPDGVERVELETRKKLSPFVSDTVDVKLLPRLRALYAESLELEEQAATYKEQARACASAAKSKLAQLYEIINKGQTPEALFEETERVRKGN